MHLLCRLGLHRWRVEVSWRYADGRTDAWVPATDNRAREADNLAFRRRCTRPGCARGEWEEV